MLVELAIIIVRGIGIGAVFSMMAMSFNIVHGSSHILNFAQGSMFILGSFAAYLLSAGDASFPHWLLLLPVVALMIAAALSLQGYITLLPLGYGGDRDSWLVTTMAASTIIGAILLLTQGPWVRIADSPLPDFALLGTRTPAPYALCAALAVMWYLALRWFLSRTMLGLAISALSQNYDAARAAGLRVRRLQLIAFAISGLIIGSAGFVAAPMISISGADSGILYVIDGFIAAVIGGLGSNFGALIGGPIVGVIAMVATYEVGGEFQDAISLLLMVGILILKPEGIFGRAAARRV
jgi:branched-chain amino acid transport system permease protein